MCLQNMSRKPSKKLAVDHVSNTLKNEGVRDQNNETSIFWVYIYICIIKDYVITFLI